MTIQLEKLVSKLELDNKGFKAGLVSAAAGVTALVAGMAVAVKATFDWAKDLDSLGDVMDGSKVKLAALAFVARKSGVGVETFAKANVLLEKGLLKSNGTLDTIGKTLEKYGIKVKDANKNTKDSVQLTDEISKKYAELSTQTERVNFLTEIYGKNGAALVDFYDTLAKEGGIDKVTQKVKAFGLAIDPDRYEQFSRNLEELKLVGLGLAVQFTEKVMPVLEKFLGWVTRTAQSPAFKQIKDNVDKLLTSLFGGDGGGTKFDLKNNDRAKSFDHTLADMINGVDWSPLGKKFGEELDKALATGIDIKKWTNSATAQALSHGISDFLLGAMNMTNWNEFGQRLDKLLALSIDSYAKPAIQKSSLGVGEKILANLTAGVIQNTPMFTAALSTIAYLSDTKLREIAKTFFNRALGWTQQMIAGFKSGMGGLLGAISSMVGGINGILRKIITAFTITIKLPSWLGGTPTVSNPGTGSKTGTKKPGRATGGAVLAGQSYNINELGRPETFTPNTSGRIDPTKEQKVVVSIDYNKLARAMKVVALKGA